MRARVPRRALARLLGGCVAIAAVACAGGSAPTQHPPATEETASPTTLAIEDVTWEQLNPARGDASPAAATLFGDRQGTVATGFLARFVDGFSSPPHIHNVSYRAVVIQGLVHNDDPAAAPMWMPRGSFWTQPRGEAHITSASGGVTIAYVEIDEGPYLVRPTSEASPSGEYPVNVHADNLVWVDAAGLRVAHVWGDPNGASPHGIMVRVPAGETLLLQPREARVRGVVIDGIARPVPTAEEDETRLAPGSYLEASQPARVACADEARCTVYLRAEGALDLQAE